MGGVEQEVTEYRHREVWRVVERQMPHAEANRTGSQLDHLAAMVFAHHALEGCANFLGSIIAPDKWFKERENFRDLKEKLAALHSLCGLPPPDYGNRPFQTIGGLMGLRNAVAHPRRVSETLFCETWEAAEMFPEGWLGRQVSPEAARRAVDAVDQVTQTLHGAARQCFPEHRRGLGESAFGGIIGTVTSSPSPPSG